VQYNSPTNSIMIDYVEKYIRFENKLDSNFQSFKIDRENNILFTPSNLATSTFRSVNNIDLGFKRIPSWFELIIDRITFISTNPNIDSYMPIKISNGNRQFEYNSDNLVKLNQYKIITDNTINMPLIKNYYFDVKREFGLTTLRNVGDEISRCYQSNILANDLIISNTYIIESGNQYFEIWLYNIVSGAVFILPDEIDEIGEIFKINGYYTSGDYVVLIYLWYDIVNDVSNYLLYNVPINRLNDFTAFNRDEFSIGDIFQDFYLDIDGDLLIIYENNGSTNVYNLNTTNNVNRFNDRILIPTSLVAIHRANLIYGYSPTQNLIWFNNLNSLNPLAIVRNIPILENYDNRFSTFENTPSTSFLEIMNIDYDSFDNPIVGIVYQVLNQVYWYRFKLNLNDLTFVRLTFEKISIEQVAIFQRFENTIYYKSDLTDYVFLNLNTGEKNIWKNSNSILKLKTGGGFNKYGWVDCGSNDNNNLLMTYYSNSRKNTTNVYKTSFDYTERKFEINPTTINNISFDINLPNENPFSDLEIFKYVFDFRIRYSKSSIDIDGITNLPKTKKQKDLKIRTDIKDVLGYVDEDDFTVDKFLKLYSI
jgi:hypothetical protein